jgi:LmbE family N-acetylglucosaminyl deacetylase
VVTGGHPGDPECGCGGTIARYTEAGHEAVLLYLSRVLRAKRFKGLRADPNKRGGEGVRDSEGAGGVCGTD